MTELHLVASYIDVKSPTTTTTTAAPSDLITAITAALQTTRHRAQLLATPHFVWPPASPRLAQLLASLPCRTCNTRVSLRGPRCTVMNRPHSD